ncbi:MAG: efflux RND transporter permease subunit [Muribaculaceae bacterium]|nr:efflux RND transporter permease subunit [Muribaculaceae bacterium]
MKKNLSSFTVIVAFIALAIVGIALVPRLPVKLSPSRNLPSLTVSFSMQNTSARVIESEVTSKLESMLARVQGVKEINSTSNNNSGYITLGLDKHADIEMTRFEVSTIVRQAWSQLPDGVTYPQITTRQADNKASRPFLSFTLNAPATPFEIQNFAEENIKPALGLLKGVYKVELSGAMPMEWQLEYDSDRLHALGLTPDDIRKAISENSGSQFLGIAEVGDEWLRVNTITTGQDTVFHASEINVSTADGTMIPLDRLVTVTYTEAQPRSYYRINGLNSIYLNISAEEDANQIQLAKEVKRLMEQLKAKMPQGYQTTLSYDATESINNELSKIYFRSGLTFLILLLFVAVITLNLRYMLIITISLIINLAVAVIFYYISGIEIQLYSLAGITISLNLIIDNIIVMTDHITHKANLKAFTSVLAATLTTVGALGIVFFLNEDIRLNLQDFVAVVIINLTVSLFVALFLVPALIERIGLTLRKSKRKRNSRKRFAIAFTRFYTRFILFCRRFRWAMYVGLVLLFGLPVFMLPEKVEGEGRWAEFYNKTLGAKTYKENVRPIVDKALGGSLRLFVKDVYSGGYFNRSESEPTLSVTATLPNGSTLSQMNDLIMKMESFLTTFPEIKQFQTQVYNANRANLSITFTPDARNTSFPYRLKSDIISKAQTLGGGSWSVYGLEDQGFNNDVREGSGSYRVKMLGFNYDELEQWADSLKNLLLTHRRIKEVNINSQFLWYKEDYSEVALNIDKQKLAKENISVGQLFAALAPIFGRDINSGVINGNRGSENILLHSRQGFEYDVWALMNMPISIGSRSIKLADFATVEKRNAPPSISKENQQYRLCLQYEYIGSNTQGRKILEADLKTINDRLPLGYTAQTEDYFYRFGKDDGTTYWLLLLVIVIIFFTTSILFNSLSQPLAIIFTIPISFIGVFLVFFFTGVNFDQGGFASFILLCGITVNASIYVLNEFNTLRSRFPRKSSLSLYIKAWNTKILPIFLTVVSTILGFIPFMIGKGKEGFWFPMALGTIGGLLMSLIGIFVYLPLFTLRLPSRKPKK